VLLDRPLGGGWAEVLASVAGSLDGLETFLAAEQTAGRPFAPAPDRVLAALSMPLADARVLIVGQDPYPTPGHAIGLAFAVDRAVRPLPRSLTNILAELEADLGVTPPPHGDLSAWSAQGVLLLNRVLTVALGAPGSHRGKGWEDVTDALVDGLLADRARRDRPLVALLWGRDAQVLAPRLRTGGAEVLAAAHPSPLSARRGFLGSRPFSRTNALLETGGVGPVDWSLPG
jgi:uracil-DNA glycosylase